MTIFEENCHQLFLSAMKKNIKKSNQIFIVGIDEVGRGALAGPLVLGAVAGYLNNQNINFLKGIKDSKHLTFKQRVEWYNKLIYSDLQLYTVSISNKFIDQYGMAQSLKEGVRRLLNKIQFEPDLVLLDGGLRAPQKYFQQTIIHGDEKNPFIAAASIYAKVRRDFYMIRLDKKFNYYFKEHKGYGTRKHYEMIKKNGLSPKHRKSFLKKLH
ncbi:MAG TPA: ribonuclease HII [Candidatus Paceibacterota bacterium]|nr:ribonuclease HII [Candidatus Paceibacterota bacterium]